jgi:hypothetical protein
MSTTKKILLAILAAVITLTWSGVATSVGGITAILPFVAPTPMLAIGVAWLFSQFAGIRFRELSAIWVAIVAGVAASPFVALMFKGEPLPDISSIIVLFFAITAVSALTGSVWRIIRSSLAALNEWREERALNTNRRRHLTWSHLHG